MFGIYSAHMLLSVYWMIIFINCLKLFCFEIKFNNDIIILNIKFHCHHVNNGNYEP